MDQDAASFECEPRRWKENEGGGALEEGGEANRKGTETNVGAVMHEIKRYLQNTPACDALWQALLEVSLSLFLCVCREGRCETV